MRPALPPIEVPGNTPMEKFDNLFRAVMAVPKSEIDKREKQWKRRRALAGMARTGARLTRLAG